VKGPGGVKRTAYLPHGTPLGYGTNPALAPGGRGYLNKTHDPNGDTGWTTAPTSPASTSSPPRTR
jgi:hypothetical protein